MSSADIAQERLGFGILEHAQAARTSIAPGRSGSITRPNAASCSACSSSRSQAGSSSSTTAGISSAWLAAASRPPAAGAQPFEHEPLVRGVLVDEHQPVGRLGDDIGLATCPRAMPSGVVGFFRAGSATSARPCGGSAMIQTRRRARRARLRFARPMKRGGDQSRPPNSERRAAAGSARDRLRLPAPHCRCVGRLRAAPVAGRKRLAQPGDDEPAHPGGIAEADFGLGRVDVDVDVLGRKLEEQRQHRMPVAREHLRIGAAHGTGEQADPSPGGR